MILRSKYKRTTRVFNMKNTDPSILLSLWNYSYMYMDISAIVSYGWYGNWCPCYVCNKGALQICWMTLWSTVCNKNGITWLFFLISNTHIFSIHKNTISLMHDELLFHKHYLLNIYKFLFHSISLKICLACRTDPIQHLLNTKYLSDII